MNTPIITIVTVSLNAVNEIEKTILSVLNQTYTDIEYIVIDGGSTDGTKDIIHKYQHRIAHYISEPDRGIYDAMNKGVDLATGKWINFMNAGDCFASETVVAEMMIEGDTNCDVLFGNTILIRDNYQVISKGQLNAEDFPKLGHQSVFIRTGLMKKSRFDLKYKISADFDFLYRIFKAGYIFYYKDVNVVLYDMTGLSATHRALLYREHCSIRGVKPIWWKILKYSIEDALPQKVLAWIIILLYGKGHNKFQF